MKILRTHLFRCFYKITSSPKGVAHSNVSLIPEIRLAILYYLFLLYIVQPSIQRDVEALRLAYVRDQDLHYCLLYLCSSQSISLLLPLCLFWQYCRIILDNYIFAQNTIWYSIPYKLCELVLYVIHTVADFIPSHVLEIKYTSAIGRNNGHQRHCLEAF